MKGNRAALTIIVILLLVIAGWWLFKRSGRGAAVDLLSTFASAEKKPAEGTFEITEADINGEKKRAIFTTAPSKIIWKMHVPDDAWLRVALGMKPEAWDKEGNGIVVHVGVSDGRTYDELFSHHLDPYANKGDRRWIPVNVDLSAYAGEEVQIQFFTNSSENGQPEDRRNDLALLGAPEVYVR
jgi:hypothetical protein